MALADLSGVPIVRGQIEQPYSGLWHADLVLAQTTDIAGPQTLNFAGVPWTCSYVREIDFAGERGVRVVAGFAGWRTSVPAKQYGGGAVSTPAVMTDVANACGEPVPVLDPSVPTSLGQAWDRQAAPASQVLNQILGPNWWADKTGTIQTSARIGAVSSAFAALSVKGASGIYEIATDFPNDWQPGVSFSGPTVAGTVSRVTHIITPSKLRTVVMVNSFASDEPPLDNDRFRDAVVGVLGSMGTATEMVLAQAVFLKWEYVVVSATPGPPVLISGQPVNLSCPFGPLANITLWPGPSGSYAVPTPGSKILVEFHEGSPSKPAVCGLDPSSVPAPITLGAGETPIALSEFIDIFINAFTTAAPVSGDGGAAIQTAVVAALTSAGYVGTTGSIIPVLSQ